MDKEILDIQADRELIECLGKLVEIRKVVETKVPQLAKNSDIEIMDMTEFYGAYCQMDKYIDSLLVEKLRQDLGMY